MNIRQKTAAIILSLLMSVSLGLAGPKGKGNDKGKSHQGPAQVSGKAAHVGVNIFVANDYGLIRNHFGADHGSLPPGLAKHGGDLPPGLEKQLRRNGHLPPGLEKRFYAFPVELERRLPPLQPGLVRGMIGVNAVIMDKKTSLILDVFKVF
jgi:hypothetical protein